MRVKKLAASIVAVTAVLALSAVAGAISAQARPGRDPVCSGPKIPKATGGYWTCTLDDEFNDRYVDPAKWVAINTASSGTTGGGACFVSSPNNIAERNGALVLTVRKEAAPFSCRKPGGATTTQYTSGQVATYGKFAQTRGRFSIRAAFPASTLPGLQSALWLWPSNPTQFGAWPTSGEMDIAEEYSYHADRVVPYLHYAYDPATVDTATNTNVVTNNYCMIDDVSAYHEYTIEWTTTKIKILYDGQTCVEDNYLAAAPLTGGAPFNQSFFLALTQSLGVAGNAMTPDTELPASTRIDWVRVWK
jgi:beta-glucanase (GH16 family)